MPHENWRLGFHIAPRHAWLNDPNGLCQFRGTYYTFFQYNPKWPDEDTKYWRRFTSEDLVPQLSDELPAGGKLAMLRTAHPAGAAHHAGLVRRLDRVRFKRRGDGLAA